MALPGTETIRFRRPTTGPNAVKPKEIKKDEFGSMAPQGWKRRHQGLLQDQVRRQQNGPLVPGLSFAFRVLLLVRTAGAMYSIISDCDEVFNFFEPLYYFQHNGGFQTWELSPQFAVRSWAYILLHWPLAHLGPSLLGLGPRAEFFALRLSLGAISSSVEAKFFRAVVETVNERVGRYLLFAMLFSAGMWSASVVLGIFPSRTDCVPTWTGVSHRDPSVETLDGGMPITFLPSSFAMYTTMLAASYWFHPATSTPTGVRRMRLAVLFTAVGAIVGWPFAAALGVPIIFEQLLSAGGEIVMPADRGIWRARRANNLVKAIIGAACVAIPVVAVDSWAYGRLVFPSLNIIIYNMFSRFGPDLYGTEPASFYVKNLFLNFNFFTLFALASLPALAITYKYDFRRLGKTQMLPKVGESSPYLLLATRLSPFYIWFITLTLQSHKEERFMFPAYPLLCFNAVVTIYLVRGWLETFFIKVTKSPYQAGRTAIFSRFTFAAIMIPSLLSIGRIIGIFKFYHAPFDVIHQLQYHTLPGVLADLGYSPIPWPKNYNPRKGEPREWDLSPIAEMDPPITLCYAAEWHRFPGSYLIPEGVEVQWVKSAMDGMMPRRWEPSGPDGLWPREETRVIRAGRFNGENRPSSEPGTYVPVSECTYLVSLNLPSMKPTALEPDYVHATDEWDTEFCAPFLDAVSSRSWSRLIWLPGGLGDEGRMYGEYCLLKRKA